MTQVVQHSSQSGPIANAAMCLLAFQVDVLYLEDGSYLLSALDGSRKEVQAGCELTTEEGGSWKLTGVLGDRQVTANVAVVDDSLHVFTRVRVFVFEMLYSVQYYMPAHTHIVW